jgi:hypothetical protein
MMFSLKDNDVQLANNNDPSPERPFEMNNAMLDTTVDTSLINASRLDEYQRIQWKHDELYHPEILYLGPVRRMSHVALHLMKYLGSFVSSPSLTLVETKAFIDSFIMVVSASNLLDISLSEYWSHNELQDSSEGFITTYVKLLSKLAKACDAADHVEDFPIRQVWIESISQLFLLLLHKAENDRIDLISDSCKRLKQVEDKRPLNYILRERLCQGFCPTVWGANNKPPR